MLRTFWTSILILALIPSLAAAQSDDEVRKVTVSGKGEVEAAPDQAVVNFSIVTKDKDPEQARQGNEQASKAALNAVRALGVDEGDIRLQNLVLQENRVWQPENRRYEVDGYLLRRSVSVTVKDLDIVPSLVAEVVSLGANRLDGVQYGLQQEGAHQRQALARAVSDARSKADHMLEPLGETVGAIMDLQEQTVYRPQPVVRSTMALQKESADAEPEAYAAGDITIVAEVVATFRIE